MEYLKDVMSSKNYEIYYKTAKSQVDNPLHYHDYLEIYYHKEGACDYIIDSRIYTLSPGDIVVIRKQKLHKAVVKDFTSEYKRYVVWMTNEFIVQIASPNGHLCHIRRPLRDLIGGQLGTH